MLQLPSLKAAASDAAGAGNFPAAAALLRQVLELQINELGPDHPDLAITLNNLALMVERSGDTAEAGRCYRRALAVATLAHGPDAASVMVNRANLAAFYREYGAADSGGPSVIPGGLDDFAPRPAPAAPPAAVLTRATATSQATPARPAARPWRNPEALVAIPNASDGRLPIFAARRPSAPPPAPAMRPLFVPQEARTSAWRRTAGAMLILVLGVALAGVPAWWLRGAGASPVAAPPIAGAMAAGTGTSGDAPGAATIATDAEAEVSAAEPAISEEDAESAAPAPIGDPLPVTEAAAESTTAPAGDASLGQPAANGDEDAAPMDSTPSPMAEEAVTSATLRVSEAGLCGVLSIGAGPWSCEPTRDTTRGGSVYYYTRVASPRDELIRHRWTRDGRLVQMVVLRILTNPGEGYRTFSRQSGPLLEAGTWQVALLAPDGRVLDETEFIVR